MSGRPDFYACKNKREPNKLMHMVPRAPTSSTQSWSTCTENCSQLRTRKQSVYTFSLDSSRLRCSVRVHRFPREDDQRDPPKKSPHVRRQNLVRAKTTRLSKERTHRREFSEAASFGRGTCPLGSGAIELSNSARRPVRSLWQIHTPEYILESITSYKAILWVGEMSYTLISSPLSSAWLSMPWVMYITHRSFPRSYREIGHTS